MNPPDSSRPGVAITQLIKLAGIVIALHEAFTTRDPVVFGMASFMLAGAQGAQNVLNRDRR